MWPYLSEPRSKYWYDEDEEGGGSPSLSPGEILLALLLIGPVFLFLALAPFVMLFVGAVQAVDQTLQRRVGGGVWRWFAWAGITLLCAGIGWLLIARPALAWQPARRPIAAMATVTPSPTATAEPAATPLPPLTPLNAVPLDDCTGRPVSDWAQPGSYTYRVISSGAKPYWVTLERGPGMANPACPPGIPATLTRFCDGTPTWDGQSAGEGQETRVSTLLGEFPAATFTWEHVINSSSGMGDVLRYREDHVAYFTCGYGLVRAGYREDGASTHRSYKSSYEIELVSFTPARP